jgi:aspartyl-tRNA(Asn)/glutamyl-tRNA(Gln) amidotransferase subunit A
LKNVDALLVPTTAIPASPTAEIDADVETYTERNLSYLRNTAIGNILNMCGLSVPCGFTKQGLPIGLMIYAKPFQENVVLRAGYAFQEVTDWHRQTPDLSWTENDIAG